MKVLDRLKERRRRKAHQRHLAERERQKELSGKDTREAAHDAAQDWGVFGQAYYGDN